MIKCAFCEDDTTAILSIAISHSSVQDSLQWHYEQKGSYTAKSGYRLACSLISEAGTSSSDHLSISSISWWKALWNLRIPTNVKIFVWKACNDMLPSIEALVKPKISVQKLCPMCKWKNESVLHCLWSCRCLKKNAHLLVP